MALAIARDIHARLPLFANAAVDDLKNIALLAAIEAAGRFNPARGKFSSFIRDRMRGAILDHLRTLDPVSRDQRRVLNKIEELSRKLGPGVPPSAIRAAAGIDLSKQYLLGEMTWLPLSGDIQHNEEITVMDIIPDKSALADTKVLVGEVREILRVTMGQLKPRTRRAMELYYFGELTMKQVGEEMGINESRVSQIHAAGLAKCREIFAARGLNQYEQLAA